MSDDVKGPWVSLTMFCDPDQLPKSGYDPLPVPSLTITPDDLPGAVRLGLVVSAFGFGLLDGEKAQLEVAWIEPNGEQLAETTVTMTIQDPWKGGLTAGPQRIPIRVPGLHWLSIRFQGRELTRIPLLVLLPASGAIPQA